MASLFSTKVSSTPATPVRTTTTSQDETAAKQRLAEEDKRRFGRYQTELTKSTPTHTGKLGT